MVLRKELQQYYTCNKEKYAQFIDTSETPYFEDIIVKNNEYANQIIYQIAADYLETNILIYRKRFYESIPNDVYSYQQEKQLLRVDNLVGCVKLLFTGKFDSGHFDLITGDNDHTEKKLNSPKK